MKGAVERQERLAPDMARLETALGEIREKLNQPAAADAQGVNATLRQLVSRVEEAGKRPPIVAVDPRPIEELSRRIDSMKGAVERQERVAPDMARIEAALGEIREKLDQPARPTRSGVDARCASSPRGSRRPSSRPTTVDDRPETDRGSRAPHRERAGEPGAAAGARAAGGAVGDGARQRRR